MGIFGRQTYNEPMSRYVDPNLAVFGQYTQTLDAQHKAGVQKYDVLSEMTDTMTSAPFEGDVAAKKALEERMRAGINEAAARGDYRNLDREIRALGRDYVKNYKPIKENAAQLAAYKEYLDKEVEAKNITRERANMAMAASARGYKGLDLNNPEGSKFNGYKLSRQIDPQKLLEETMAKWEASGTYAMVDGPTGKITWQTTKGVDPNKVYAAAVSYLSRNSDLQASLNDDVYLNTKGVDKIDLSQFDKKFVTALRKDNPKITDAEIYARGHKNDVIKSAALNLAAMKGHSVSELHMQTDDVYNKLLSAELDKKAAESAAAVQQEVTYGNGEEVILPPHILDGVEFDSANNPTKKEYSQRPVLATGLWGIIDIPQTVANLGAKMKDNLNYRLADLANGITGAPGKADTEVKTYLQSVRDSNPDLANKSNTELATIINVARQKSAVKVHGAYSLPTIKTEELNKKVLGGARAGAWDGMTIYVKGAKTDGTASNALKELDLEGDAIKKAFAAANINGIVPTKDGYFSVTMPDGDGVPRTVYIKGSDTQTAEFELVTKAAEFERLGKVGTNKITFKGNTYEAETILRPGEKPEDAENVTRVFKYLTPAKTEEYIKEQGGERVVHENPTLFTKDSHGNRVFKLPIGTPEDIAAGTSAVYEDSPVLTPYKKAQPKNTYRTTN